MYEPIFLLISGLFFDKIEPKIFVFNIIIFHLFTYTTRLFTSYPQNLTYFYFFAFTVI